MVVCKLAETGKSRVFFLKLEMVCCELTLIGSLLNSTGAALAKPRLPMAFLGLTEETDSVFPHVRLLELIRDDK